LSAFKWLFTSVSAVSRAAAAESGRLFIGAVTMAPSFSSISWVHRTSGRADVFAGIRLALGVAWIVLVPAEYLGVTSGLDYAINDARDTLSYDRLAAIVVVIGLIGFTLDRFCMTLIGRYSRNGEK
jgi:NitT/TauT family transport system permease protein